MVMPVARVLRRTGATVISEPCTPTGASMPSWIAGNSSVSGPDRASDMGECPLEQQGVGVCPYCGTSCPRHQLVPSGPVVAQGYY